MVTGIRIVSVLLFFIGSVMGTIAHAQIVVQDPKTTQAVLENTAFQSAVEGLHNTTLDTIRKKEEKIAEYAATMATIKEAYLICLQNVKGFGAESAFYKQIAKTGVDIVVQVPRVINSISKSKLPGKIWMISEVSDLALKTQQLAMDFVNIVTNGKVENPLKIHGTGDKKKDSYNLLDRYDRLQLANTILTDLSNIKYKLMVLEYSIMAANWNTIFFRFDPEGYVKFYQAKSNAIYLKTASEWLVNTKK